MPLVFLCLSSLTYTQGESEDKAAISIQKVFRGKKERKHRHRNRALEEEEEMPQEAVVGQVICSATCFYMLW